MKFKNYLELIYKQDNEIEERTLLESGASLSRILSKLKGDDDFVMITAFRKNNTYKQNQQNNNSLIKSLRQKLGNIKAYGAYRLVGHWKECSVELPDNITIDKCSEYDGKIQDTLEESWLILNDQKNPKFFDVTLEMARKYKQDAIVARIGKDFGLFGKNGKKWEDFGAISGKSIDYGFNRIIGLQGFTELKKTRNKGRIINIILEGISIPNPSNSSNKLYKAMNLLY